ncbi:MAG TPA: helix-turn-helix domain-containing protein [Candidatus Polarisedimenticolia bacterium]|nr:helix-turn-helix domain-containing protein [Candidatus Polarisedimenticolia bacterium]
MKSSPLKNQAPIIAPEHEKKALGAVEDALGKSKPGKARLVGPDGQHMILPHSLYLVLREAARELADGNGISILPVMAELTTQQAAEHLSVSRPFLIKLLEDKHIPFHMAGTHRRIYLRDLLAFKEQRDTNARRALNQLSDDAQDLQIYDE